MDSKVFPSYSIILNLKIKSSLRKEITLSSLSSSAPSNVHRPFLRFGLARIATARSLHRHFQEISYQRKPIRSSVVICMVYLVAMSRKPKAFN